MYPLNHNTISYKLYILPRETRINITLNIITFCITFEERHELI